LKEPPVRPRQPYDVFLSFAGPGRALGRNLAYVLRGLGLRVFLDEDSIDHFSSISATIKTALSRSKALVAYYSADYANRYACQVELLAAFLAGQREGDPAARIIVVNPEPLGSHIAPPELADSRFALPPSSTRAVASLAQAIKGKVEGLVGTIGDVRLDEHPRWYGHRVIPGMHGFEGRFGEMWLLHSALVAIDFPLAMEPFTGAAVAVTGPPGSGKTTLVAAYGWWFGAAYPGGVHWISAAGPDPLAHYHEQVLTIAELRGLRTEGMSQAGVRGRLADLLAGQPGHSLVVVDDVPDWWDSSRLHDFVLPGGVDIRTVLVSRSESLAGQLPSVTLRTCQLPTAVP
jgi:TIR domain